MRTLGVLLRQYLPRRLDFRTLSQADLDNIAWELFSATRRCSPR